MNAPAEKVPDPFFSPHVEMLDADKVQGPLHVRRRRDGDHFHPLGSSGAKSVSDFLTDLKLPASHRHSVLCLCDEAGIVSVWPLRIDQRVSVTNQTRRVLRVASR
jgi:tRNA(Ile)-lysidine synthase